VNLGKNEPPWWAHLLVAPFIALLSGVFILWEAYALQLGWRWLAVPAGLPDWPLRVWVGLGMVIGVFSAQTASTKEDEGFTKRAVTRLVTTPASTLLFAYVLSKVLP
jgi:hypothetical protein